ncbi:TRAP transporter small permease [Neotabrizicola sp. VNH66]|uniref:TRAP transporter small permease n=1 Tax=Neotabrizicola sp. VNH66 TaxID=3400918 RepID=UPI003BFD1A13
MAPEHHHAPPFGTELNAPLVEKPHWLVTLTDRVDHLVAVLCRTAVLLTGAALTIVLTIGVVGRYVLVSGGLAAVQELPERLFPWFIVAGIVLAAQAGGHMSVEWLPGKLGPRGRRNLFIASNAIVIVAYAVLTREALRLAEIASIERSPVLGLSGAHGHWAMAAGFGLTAIVTICSCLRTAVRGTEAAYHTRFEEI